MRLYCGFMVRRTVAMARLGFRRATRVAGAPQDVLHVFVNNDIKRSHPRYRRWVLRVFGLELLLIFVLAVVAPTVLVPLLATLVAFTAFYAWRARSQWGRARGLPQGSVGVGTRPISDPDHYRNGFAAHGPIFKSNYLDLPMLCVEGIERGTRLFDEHEDQLRPAASPWNRFIPGGLVRWMDGDTHDEYRRILAGALGARLFTAVQPSIDEGIDRSCAAMAEACALDPSGAVQPFPRLIDMVFSIWADVFFGFRHDDQSTAEVLAIYDVISLERQSPDREVRRALDRLEHLIRQQHASAASAVEVRPTLLSEIERRQPDALDRPTTVRNLIYLMESSGNDVAGLLNWVLKHAVDHPEILKELGQGSVDEGPKSLANRMVSETLRLEQSEELARVVRETFTFEDQVLPAKWAVRVRVHESHRDPSIFESPNDYDPNRFLESLTPLEYAPFGVDKRACTGASLTRTIATSFITKVATGYEVVSIADGPREFSKFRHWAPSSEWRTSWTVRSP